MKRNLFFVMGAMLMMTAGTMMTACNNDDEVVTPETPAASHSTRQLPNQANFVKTVTEEGYLWCDKVDNTWYIQADYQGPEIHYDGGTIFYLYDLPAEYQKEGLKVKATLDCYIFHHFDEKEVIIKYAGWEYYDAVLKQIEIAE